MNLFFTCFYFASLIPISIPIVTIGLILNYWITKYMLFRVHKQPHKFSGVIIEFFIDILPLVIFIWGGSSIFWLYSIKEATSYPKNTSIIKKNYNVGFIVAMAIPGGILYYSVWARIIFWIFRPCIRCLCFCCLILFKKNDVTPAVDTYDENCFQFHTDYDCENPFTSVKGWKRLLKIKIEVAIKNGDYELVK